MNESESDAFDRLQASALSQAVETIADLYETTPASGDVDRVFLAALQAVARFALREHTCIRFLKPGDEPPVGIENTVNLYVAPHEPQPDRFDLAVFAYDHSGRLLKSPGWRRLIIEVGLSENAAPEIPTSFLGRGRATRNVSSMRFTKNEILRDPWIAAIRVFEWASESFG